MTKVLVLCATGMLGHTLLRQLSADSSFQVAATARTTDGLPASLPQLLRDAVVPGVDGREVASVRKVLGATRPDVVINCIGVIKQDPGMADVANTIALNSLVPHLLAQACLERQAPLMHVSRFRVFRRTRRRHRRSPWTANSKRAGAKF
ncbi:MAG: hypothetical protein DLM58_13095 [Pseudonocardiales bacterium]|nr:MAG: hypothetical protein DLM58_13095 [Pseudonocardiales bacterium]